ncbi:hypothetical protein HHK36_016616 [Tetracentron sinense]|uniref:SIT4 phosphatase-associated family protein n=1 Tax=Tetracentron sinense TaxID=13715 RepID=A0A834YXI1_TETSI|nr:hypothetical protein HHK36_016616 [Tetracentron sinense]
MFWKLTALSSSSPWKGKVTLDFGLGFSPRIELSLPEVVLGTRWNRLPILVESILDKENFTLDELLDEEEIIQECKALNGRLINLFVIVWKSTYFPQIIDIKQSALELDPGTYSSCFHFYFLFFLSLRDKAQVEQLLRYIVEESSEDGESKRAFKFPFISCEIFTCEIDVILKTLVEEEELMNLLFSFLEPSRPHSALLAGYFSKVVVCLMLRKTVPLMNYVQEGCGAGWLAAESVFKELSDPQRNMEPSLAIYSIAENHNPRLVAVDWEVAQKGLEEVAQKPCFKISVKQGLESRLGGFAEFLDRLPYKLKVQESNREVGDDGWTHVGHRGKGSNLTVVPASGLALGNQLGINRKINVYTQVDLLYPSNPKSASDSLGGDEKLVNPNLLNAHQNVFRQLVDLIGITSIMEVLVRLVAADDHMYPNFMDVMQWLADSNLLEMIVDKLNPSSTPEVHTNAAETLCAITRNAPSALAAKLSSPSFVARIFGHALEDSRSKSGLVHSLSVCISLLDPKRSVSSSMVFSIRSQHLYEPPISVNPETVSSMLPKLGELLIILNVSSDEKVLPTTYGELRPPLGKHRLKVDLFWTTVMLFVLSFLIVVACESDSSSETKHNSRKMIVEFIAVLLRTGNEIAEKELVGSGAIQRVIDLFFEYPYNNSLHHHIESIILSCLKSKSNIVIEHLFCDCDLIGKILQTERHPAISSVSNQPTLPAAGRQAPRAGNLGHITRISNKLAQLGNGNSHIQSYLQESSEWIDWQANVLQERNTMENVYRWVCGYASYPIVWNTFYYCKNRPSASQDRTRDSDEDELHDRDYDIAALANNLNQAYRYSMHENDNAEEGHGPLDRDDEDVYFDDESAEVMISSLRLGDDQESCLFTNSNWFSFQNGRVGSELLSTSNSEKMDKINLNETANAGSSSCDDEVVVREDEELVDSRASFNGANTNFLNGYTGNGPMNGGDLKSQDEKASASSDLGFFQYNDDPFGDRPFPDWVGWMESSDYQVSRSDGTPFNDNDNPSVNFSDPPEAAESTVNSLLNGEVLVSNGTKSTICFSERPAGPDGSQSATVPSLFEEDVEFVGVELEGTERAMEHALKEGIVGEAGPLKRKLTPRVPEKVNSNEDGANILQFNDTIYWRVDQDVAVVQE